MPGASRSIVIHAPMEKIFQIITDYERYPEFLPEVKKVRAGAKQGGVTEVEFEVALMKTIRYTLRLQEEPPAKVSWTFVKGEFMKDNTGGWVLEPAGEGAVKATYTIDVALGPLVPKAIVNALVDTSLPKTLEAYKKRAEAR